MLDQVPPEIIAAIARQLALAPPTDRLEPSLPPLPPVNLLLTCRSIYEAIAPATNPRLYGRLYRSYFDTAAAARRLGGQLKAQDLRNELERRVRALYRLRNQVEAGDVTEVQDGDLWVLYLMLIENDGKNVEHLLSPQAILHLPTFLELYHKQQLLASAIQPGYPPETVGRSLAMWIAWLVWRSGSADETAEQREERMFVLRPYVFAAQQYEVCIAPWVLPDLPLAAATQRPDTNGNHDPFVANLAPRNRMIKLEMYGREITLSSPILAHAAILRFFYKQSGDEWDGSEAGTPAVSEHDSSPALTDGIDIIDSNLGQASQASYADKYPAGGSGSVAPHSITNSLVHDRDFLRLRNCYDPHQSRGMKRSAWRGSWDGCWEGKFSFFDFDAFRTMLAGNARALYEGPYGEQTQVWRIKETYVRRKGYVKKSKADVEDGSDSDSDGEEESDDEEVKARAAGSDDADGQSDDAAGSQDHLRSKDLERICAKLRDDHRATKRSKIDKGKKKIKAQKKAAGLPLSGPMINAGFPTTQRPSIYASMASAAAEAETLRETIRQQVDAIEGYEVVPEDELDEMLQEEDGGEEAGLELLLSGTGHSAWGKFLLKGRVRAWDGMASLVKEYAVSRSRSLQGGDYAKYQTSQCQPDSRGKWIYRGYVVSGDTFVGRWRDTFTPEAYVGYEGTFILSRR